MRVARWAQSCGWFSLYSVMFLLVSCDGKIPGLRDSSDGYTDVVQWDNYSLLVNGQRLFLHSGEFHTFRLPVPSLWLDILQKIKATGMNGVSVYLHWGYVNPSPGVVDFDGVRALQPLFDAAKAAGIWIVLRPGPYINAETTAGGIAHWATSQVSGDLRSNDTDYRDAWTPYIEAVANLAAPNQVTEGGPIIAIQVDNEFSQSGFGNADYFVQIENVLRENGIVVPLTYNDPGELRSFINGTGAVDIYGFDAYPQRYDCSAPDVWQPLVTDYHFYHEAVDPSEPLYLPEASRFSSNFQGGSLNPWGPGSPNYYGCQLLTGPAFENVFYQTLWATNAKMLNYYMFYGGTSWGALPYPGVYTSYDYGGAIAENRVLTPKHTEMKRQGLFLSSSREFYKTDWIGNSTSTSVIVSNPNVLIVYLANPDTNAGFYIARQNDSTSIAVVNFTFRASTSKGIITLPQNIPSITLSGRQSKVVVTDYAFGNSRALYSTAPVLYAGRIGERDILLLYGDSDQQHEAAISLSGRLGQLTSHPLIRFSGPSGSSRNETIISIRTGLQGLVTVWDSEAQLILFGDTDTASSFFAPVIPSFANAGGSTVFPHYLQLGSNTTVLVGGPYLVRNATISGTTLELRGDLNASTMLTVVAPPKVSKVTWNGEPVALDMRASRSLTSIGGFVGNLKLSLSPSSVNAPKLQGWKFRDSLPEIQSGFSDEHWTVANHTTTNIPFPMYYGDGRILYGCDYGFCENIVVWRGHFNATGVEKRVNLTINGGEAFAGSVWLNDVFLGTAYGNSSNGRNSVVEVNGTFSFPSDSVKAGRDNVITIVQDNMGLDENGYGVNLMKSARGVRGFELDTGNFSTWRVQGKLGGYTNFPDRTRGVFNEGGLFGERQGWHLPEFDTSEWESRDISEGLPDAKAGIGFFVTTFTLDISSTLDVPMSFVFDGGSVATTQPYRAILFVNGWMMGKRVANLGPQTKFPVHEGILDYTGRNTVAVALWAMEANAKIVPTLSLQVDGIFEGGIGEIVANNPPFEVRHN